MNMAMSEQRTVLRKHLRRPTVAWPTVLLTAGILGVWLSVPLAVTSGLIPMAAGFFISMIAASAAFTPMHDAAHRSVGKSKALNEVIGWLCCVPLVAPFAAFREVHLTHHKHVNQPDPMVDPDMWSGKGPVWSLPLRWATQDLFYYYWALRMGKQLKLSVQLAFWAGAIVLYATAGTLTYMGFGWEVLFLWLLPARAAVTLLAFAFNFLPHHPHEVTDREDRLQATSILLGPGFTFAFLYQNLHLIHHLYPGVPFYRYGKIWQNQREGLLAGGAREVTLL